MTVAEAVLKRALDTLDDVVYIYGVDGGLVYWNQRLNDLFGLTDAELAGMAPTEFFEPDDRPAVAAAVDEVIDTGETVVEAWGQTTEGRLRFELTGRLLTEADGTVTGFAGIGRDVTQRYEQAGALRRQNERLTEFADVLAHDIRNPLSVASGNLSLLRAGSEAADLGAIEGAHDRIERIVSDIRLAATDGIGVTEWESVDLTRIAGEAWQYVDTGGAVLDCPDGLVVDGDADRLLRLFENLFRNAVEHADSTVAVRLERTDSGFAVADDGPGIDPADRAHVFEPGMSRSDDGTGFGLYIVRAIARAHNWDVRATAAESGGARFEFDFC